MSPELGHLSVIAALCLSFFQAVIPMVGSFVGHRSWMRLGHSLALGQFVFLGLAFVCLISVFIQDDSWIMNSESSEMFLAPCAAYKSTTDLKPLFVKTMKDVITSSMSNLEYTQREYSPEELSERGFDALISIKHHEAKSNFTTKQGFFGFTLKTATDVSVEFSVTGKNGETFSKNSASSGMGEDFTISALICSNDKGVQEALASSFPKIAEMGMLYVRTGLESVK